MYPIYGLPFTINKNPSLVSIDYHTYGSVMGTVSGQQIAAFSGCVFAAFIAAHGSGHQHQGKSRSIVSEHDMSSIHLIPLTLVAECGR